jgi:hypothetical protein
MAKECVDKRSLEAYSQPDCSFSRQCFWCGAGEQPSAAGADLGLDDGSHSPRSAVRSRPTDSKSYYKAPPDVNH